MVIIISTEGIMGRIKSAWEIALERTENIEVDAEKIRHSANIEAKVQRSIEPNLV